MCQEQKAVHKRGEVVDFKNYIEERKTFWCGVRKLEMEVHWDDSLSFLEGHH